MQPGQVLVTYGNIHKGFAYPAIRFYILSEGDLFGKEKKKRRKKTTYEGKHIQEFSQLSVGDYVIHENHGLGIYQGTSRMTVGGVEKDYMKITYGDGGNLYIPVTQMNGSEVCWSGCREGSEAEPPGRRRSGIRRRRG